MRTNCRSCYANKLVDVISLGELHLSDFVEPDERNKPKKYPLSLVLCRECHLLQLKHTTPPSLLYTERYGYKSGISKTMKDELSSIAKEAEKLVRLNPGNIVLDIGCNDKTLLAAYKNKGILRVGFDPVSRFQKEFNQAKEYFVNDYFSFRRYNKLFPKRKAKVITAIAMFYDLDDPNVFVADIKRVLDRDGVFIIQQNYLVGMLGQNAFDNIVHEHLEYYSLLSLEKLLRRHGLEVFDVSTLDINGGSFRTYVKHASSSFSVSKEVNKMRDKEIKLKLNDLRVYRRFADRVKKTRNTLRNFIKKEVGKGKTVYIYGASTRGNTLLQYCGLNNDLIKKAVERNPEKWGKKIVSVDIPIVSEKDARKLHPDYMLVLPWYFRDEFLKREKEYLENGGKFIFPLPEMEIVG